MKRERPDLLLPLLFPYTAPGKFLLISSFKRCRGTGNKRFLMKGCLPGDSVPAFKRDDLSAGTTPRRRP